MAECSCRYRTLVLLYNRECCEKNLQRSFCCLGIPIELGLKTNKGNKSLLIPLPKKQKRPHQNNFVLMRSSNAFKLEWGRLELVASSCH